MSDDRFSNPVEARKKAMDYLARREHASGELIEKLVAFGFDRSLAESAVAGLVDDGLQCDERFVESFVRSRVNQGKGPVRIRSELRERGVDDELINGGLDAADEDWRALAIAVRRKKFGAERPGAYPEKARQMRFLQSRGFDSDHIQAAVSAGVD